MDLPLLKKIDSNVEDCINRGMLFDAMESKQIVRVGARLDINDNITLDKLPLLEKLRTFQVLGHKIVIVFDDYKKLNILKEDVISKKINILLGGMAVILNINKVEVVRNSKYQGLTSRKIFPKKEFLKDISENNISIMMVDSKDKHLVADLDCDAVSNVSFIILSPNKSLKFLSKINLANKSSLIIKKLESFSSKLLSEMAVGNPDFGDEEKSLLLKELMSDTREIFIKARCKVILGILKRIFPQDINDLSLGYLKKRQKIKVTVIIAAYNRMDFLPEAINSLMGQFYKNIEIIIVDDGSSDGTRQYCEYILYKYRGVYDIKYFFQKNKGVGSARNVGLRNATGDLITILDHDDYMLEDGIIDRVIPFINNPSINVVYSKRDTLLDDGYERIRQRRYEPYHSDGFTKLKTKEEQFSYLIKKQVTFGANTMMYRKKILKKTGLFYENKKFMGLEHNAFLLMIFKNYFANFVDSVTYLMRRNHVSDHLSKKFENNSLRSEMFAGVLLPRVLKDLKIDKKQLYESKNI